MYETNAMPYELDIKMPTRRIGLRVQDCFSFRLKLIIDWYDCKIISSTFRQDLLTMDRTFRISHWAAFKFSRLLRQQSGFSFVFLFKTDNMRIHFSNRTLLFNKESSSTLASGRPSTYIENIDETDSGRTCRSREPNLNKRIRTVKFNKEPLDTILETQPLRTSRNTDVPHTGVAGTYKKTVNTSTRTRKSDDSFLTDRTDDFDDLEPIIDSVLHCEDVHIPTDTSRSSFFSTNDGGTKASIVLMASAFCMLVFNNILV